MRKQAGKYGEYEIYPLNASSCQVKAIKKCLITNVAQLWIERITLNQSKKYEIGDKVDIEINPLYFKRPIEQDIFIYSYVINKITKLNKNNYVLHEFLENESKIFLTPILGKTKDFFSYKERLCNTYIDTSYTQKYKGQKVLYLLYKATPLKSYFQFEDKLKKHELFIDQFTEVRGENRFSLFIFRIPEIFHSDLILFKQGKFKDLSILLKNQIVKFHSYTNKHLIYQVLIHAKELSLLKMKELNITEEDWYKKGKDGISPNCVSMRPKPNLTYEIL